MLHAKAVPAEGRRAEGPVVVSGVCTTYSDGQGGTVELSSDTSVTSERVLEFMESQLWHWVMSSSQVRSRKEGKGVSVAPGDRCLVAVMPTTGELHSVQALPRLTGRIHSRPSASVGQIAPDQEHLAMCGGNCFVRVSQVTGAQQLPAVGERVEFHLMPNPERADRLWAAEVVPVEADSLSAQPIGRSTAVATGGGTEASDTASQPTAPGAQATDTAALGTFDPRRRIYVGRLPAEAMWRDLQELFAPFGELVHVQLPCDEANCRRGFGVVEFDRPESASAAVAKLELAEMKGTQLVVRADEVVVNAHGGATVYVGNLAPTVTWQMLREHVAASGADPSGGAHVRVMDDGANRSLGFGFIEFRNAASADAAVWTLHNKMLEGRALFMRQDCDMSKEDPAEAAARRDAHAKNISLVGQLASWVSASAPLIEWGWSERYPSAWAPQHSEATLGAVAARERSTSIAWS